MLRLCILSFAMACACAAQSGRSFLNPRIPLDQARRWQHIEMRPSNPVLLAGKPESIARCAHIVTLVPRKDMDKMSIGNVSSDRAMPQYKGLDTCPEDIRVLAEQRPTASKAPEDGESGRD